MPRSKIWTVLNDPKNIVMDIKYGDTFKADAVTKALNQYEQEIEYYKVKLEEANERIKNLNRQLIK